MFKYNMYILLYTLSLVKLQISFNYNSSPVQHTGGLPHELELA
jgi:hypothetical protein